jgi:hypothetical protein
MNPIPPEEVSRIKSRNKNLIFVLVRVLGGDVFVAEALAPVESTRS